jgi:hypothetical protein
MLGKSPQKIPACAAYMLARQEWFDDPTVVNRARVAQAGRLARFLGHKRFSDTDVAAITLGHTIYFLKSEKYAPHTPAGLALLAHEIKHVEQYERQNRLVFYAQYLWDQVRHSYANVRFEREASALQKQVKKHIQDEFETNLYRSPCRHQAGPHAPNHAFVRRPPQAFIPPN